MPTLFLKLTTALDAVAEPAAEDHDDDDDDEYVCPL